MSESVGEAPPLCSSKNYSVLDQSKLNQVIDSGLGSSGTYAPVLASSSNLFSSHSVFLDAGQASKIEEIIKGVEEVLSEARFRELVRLREPPFIRPDSNVSGSLIGYDFHVSEDGVKLIEINTNPGGAMLNMALSRAQIPCCEEVRDLIPDKTKIDGFESNLLSSFLKEWGDFEAHRPLKVVAIVDENPSEQFLYPEFLLFQQLFIRNGFSCVIADPRELVLKEGGLWVKGLRIDMVYNRLTDFYFDLSSSSVLKLAYEEKLALVSPNPAAYALYSDKRNLVLLSDRSFLDSLELPESVIDTLQRGIPRTESVEAADAERLWAHRRELYFKPANGFGARAVYRGDKITKKVFSMILEGGYVAQDFFAPGEFLIGQEAPKESMKFDIRCFVSYGSIIWMAARVFQGQATNFRTPGGGFAPVLVTNTGRA